MLLRTTVQIWRRRKPSCITCVPRCSFIWPTGLPMPEGVLGRLNGRTYIYEQAFQRWNLPYQNSAVESQITIVIIVYASLTFQQISVLLVPKATTILWSKLRWHVKILDLLKLKYFWVPEFTSCLNISAVEIKLHRTVSKYIVAQLCTRLLRLKIYICLTCNWVFLYLAVLWCWFCSIYYFKHFKEDFEVFTILCSM